jgi:hypothetical protein
MNLFIVFKNLLFFIWNEKPGDPHNVTSFHLANRLDRKITNSSPILPCRFCIQVRAYRHYFPSHPFLVETYGSYALDFVYHLQGDDNAVCGVLPLRYLPGNRGPVEASVASYFQISSLSGYAVMAVAVWLKVLYGMTMNRLSYD